MEADAHRHPSYVLPFTWELSADIIAIYWSLEKAEIRLLSWKTASSVVAA